MRAGLKTLLGCTAVDAERFAALQAACAVLVQAMADQALLNPAASFAVDRHTCEVIASRESYPEVLVTFRLCAIGTKTKTQEE